MSLRASTSKIRTMTMLKVGPRKLGGQGLVQAKIYRSISGATEVWAKKEKTIYVSLSVLRYFIFGPNTVAFYVHQKLLKNIHQIVVSWLGFYYNRKK